MEFIEGEWPPKVRQMFEVFFPHSTARIDEIITANRRFVHYTTAEVAFSILTNGNVWMRNATTMNDFSETQHGTECLVYSWRDHPAGTQLSRLFDSFHPGFSADLVTRFDSWLPDFQNNTYLTCVSEHLDEEDDHGRLSMWRAYGGRTGVALVMNTTPFRALTDNLKAYSSPVAYLTKEGFALHLTGIAERISENRQYVSELPYEALMDVVFTMFRFAVLCTKHPGFSEEREWRVIYGPTYERSPVIIEDAVVVRGVPQIIQKIPLVNSPEGGLVGADIPSMIDRLIIGPTDERRSIIQALTLALERAGVAEPASRIRASGIPLRHCD